MNLAMALDEFPARHRNYQNNNLEALPKAAGNHLPTTQPAQQQNQKVVVNVPDQIVDRKQNKVYTKGSLLGEGGFAQCYQVSDSNSQAFAAKVIPKLSLRTPKQKHKLFAEIKIHQMLSHPNIVKFHHVFEDDHNVYMILELCHNKTFVDLLRKRRRMTETEVRYYMLQLLGGVQYMHGQRVIHRDLKLGNLFISSDMHLKIGDFGLAAILKHDGERKKTICGTPNYIAPEVLFDTSNGHSFEVDIWSLGVVMYTMLIGKPPFQTKDVKSIYKKIRENSYEFPLSIDVSDAGRSLIASLLNSRPESRPGIDDVLLHSYFREPIPCSIPISALHETPEFPSLMRKWHNTTTTLTASSLLSGFSTLSLSANQNSRHAARTVLAEIGLQAATQTRAITTTTVNSMSGHAELPVSDNPSPSGAPSSSRQVQMPGAYVSSPLSYETRVHGVRPKRTLTRESTLPKIPQVQSPKSSTSPTLQPQCARSSTKSPSTSSITTSLTTVAVVASQPLPRPTSPPAPKNFRMSTLETRLNTHSNFQSTSTTPLSQSVNSSTAVRKINDIKPLTPPVAFRQSVSGPSTSASRYVNVLEAMQENLSKALYDMKSGVLSKYISTNQVVKAPKEFISKWIDYSNKYGLGYQLTNGCVGVYFNDSTSIILAPDHHHFEYLYCERDTNKNSIHRQPYTMSTYPQELNKKVSLLLHFKSYMQENLFQACTLQSSDTTATQNLEFLTKYMRTKHGVVFRLSNRVVQINFFDHSKIVLSNDAHTITFIDKSRTMFTFALSSLISANTSQKPDITERLNYARDIIQQMVIKKKLRTSSV
ncbi:hypothetical protein SeMB42_g02425 [Synchytrium endobioticum]|nr:hypothetical protein SeMB42_g02425 [Synchytrium endobioticum]